MKALIEYIAQSLVDDPTEVHVTQVPGRSKDIIELEVAKEDMGRVIGRHGRIAIAMRTLLKVCAAHEGKRISLDIVEPE